MTHPNQSTTPTPYLKKLDSGYWHFRPSRQQFAQWPSWRECLATDVFGASDEDRQTFADLANQKVRETTK